MNFFLELKCFRLMKEHGNVLASKIILSFLNDASLHFSNFEQCVLEINNTKTEKAYFIQKLQL